MEEYSDERLASFGLSFDFSLALALVSNMEFWQVFTLANQQKQLEILKICQESGRTVNEVILDKLFQNQPRFETHRDLFERAKAIRKFFNTYIG